MKEQKMGDVTGKKLTAGEAAKLVGKSVPTITRAIKSGKLTAEPRKPRGWQIDPAELFRVFEAVTDETNGNVTMLEPETPIRDSVLQAKLEVLEERFDDAQATIDDLRARLTKSDDERTRLTLMLTADAPKSEPQKRGFWARLTG